MATPTRRGPGRPPIKDGEATINLNTRVVVSDYDALYGLATERRVSMAETVRLAVKQLVRNETPPKR